MIEIFKEQLHREHPHVAQTLIDALHTPAPVSLRLNPRKFTSDRHLLPAETDSAVPWEPMARYLNDRPVFTLDPLFHAGAYYVQEASSMWLGEAVRRLRESGLLPASSLKVLDLCAAPGGKSTHLAAILGDDDLLVANETHRSRVQILTENLIKWGYPNVVVTGNEARDFQALGSWFDLIVVDAPCSGEGLFRRDPDAIAHWSTDAVERCALRQHQILDDIWPVLKPGGVLIYSTCTYNLLENDAQVSRLIQTYGAEGVDAGFDGDKGRLQNHLQAGNNPIEAQADSNPGKEQSDNKPGQTQADIKPGKELVNGLLSYPQPDGSVMYRCMPGHIRGEGFTFSVLRKPAKADIAWGRSKGSSVLRTESGHPHLEAITHHEDYQVVSTAKQCFAVHRSHIQNVRALADATYLHLAGLTLGDEKRVGQSLAMSVETASGYFTDVDVDKAQAQDYLRRESIQTDTQQNGLVRVCYQGLGLGFGKATRGRINNHYPQEWRIRMK